MKHTSSQPEADGLVHEYPKIEFEQNPLVRYANLVYILARRDITARYRRSSLGIFWALLDPLFFIAVFSMLRIFLGISSGDVPYILFFASGLIPWNLFINTVNNSTVSIIQNGSILKKTKVPYELFPIVSAATALFDFCMALIIIFLMMVIFRSPFTWNLLWLPLLVLIMLLLALGAGMWISAFGVFRRDISRASTYFFQLLFYVSPIFYPIDLVPPEFKGIYRLNPLVGIIDGFRNVLGSGIGPDLGTLGLSTLVVLVIAFTGWRIFRQRAVYFPDYL